MASRFSRLIGKKSQPHFVLDSTASPLTPPSLLPSSGGLDSDEEDILEFYAMDGVESDDHFHSPAWSGKFEPAHSESQIALKILLGYSFYIFPTYLS